LVEDDEEQARRARVLIEGAIERGDRMFVPLVVLCELVWVLRAAYHRSPAEIAATVRGLLRAAQVEIEQTEIAHRATASFESGRGDFADYVIRECAEQAGCERVATFDLALQGEPGFIGP